MKLTTTIFVLVSSLYFISCDKDVSVTPPDAPPPTGAFTVTSNPPGAEIYVNNRITGHVTPDSLSWLAAGKYDIKLKLPLYRDTVISINVAEKNNTSLSVDFTANPAMHGSVICQSEPDHAEIFLNGQPTQKYTPDTLKGLLPGIYNITFKSFGCRSDSMKVAVKSSVVSNASLSLQDTTIWVTYNKSNSGLPSNDLNCVAVGINGAIWVGTMDRGLVRFDGLNWKVYNTSNSNLPSNNITSLAIYYKPADNTVSETIYIGTPEGLAIMYVNTTTGGEETGHIYVYNKSNSLLPDNYVTSVSVDKLDHAWVGTTKGLMMTGVWGTSTYNLTSTFGESNVSCVSAVLSVYNQSGVWVGMENKGLGFYNTVDNSWKHYDAASGLPGSQLRSIGADDWNEAWFGCATDTDPSRSSLGHFKNNSMGSQMLGTSQNRYQSIFVRYDGVWVGTSEGLFLLNPSGGTREFTTTNSGLPSNSVTGVNIDSGGRVWIATADKGLVVYKKNLNK